MKRFILFVCAQYEPHGGWKDMKTSYDTIAEAKAAGRAYLDADNLQTYHVLDISTWTIVEIE